MKTMKTTKKNNYMPSKSRIKLVENIKMWSAFSYFICAIGVVGNNDLNMPVETWKYVGCIVTTLLFASFAYYENVLRERRRNEIRRKKRREAEKAMREAELEAYLASDDEEEKKEVKKIIDIRDYYRKVSE